MRNFTTAMTFPVGKRGEYEFSRRYPGATDVRDSQLHRWRGVDYIYQSVCVDCKTDTHRPENFFLEFEVSGAAGALYKTRADFWWYYFLNSSQAYFIAIPQLLYWLEGCKEKRVATIQSSNKKTVWSARGYVVPVEGLVNAHIAFIDGKSPKTARD